MNHWIRVILGNVYNLPCFGTSGPINSLCEITVALHGLPCIEIPFAAVVRPVLSVTLLVCHQEKIGEVNVYTLSIAGIARKRHEPS